MDVKIKDREEEIEYLRMALNMCELPVNYTQVDLIIEVVKETEKLKGNFSIKDGVKIHHGWRNKWDAYFEDLKTEKS